MPSPSLSIQFGSSTLYPVDAALNLGVSWDKHLRMKLQIGRICKAASLGLFRIGALNNLLDKISMERLVHAFIYSRLDYGNALLFGLSTKELNRLQVIQNAAARLISGAKKHDHITPVLKSLHWLPIKARIEYKLLVINFNTICGCSPAYLNQIINLSKWNHYNLRSAMSTNLLQQPRSRSKYYGDRTFSIAAPRLWNLIPDYIRQSASIDIFKKCIKTYLFNKFFP